MQVNKSQLLVRRVPEKARCYTCWVVWIYQPAVMSALPVLTCHPSMKQDGHG
jgi:hypothetical protein